MKLPFVSRAMFDNVLASEERLRAENREWRTALRNANEELRRSRALLADLRTDPVGTLRRINAAFHGEKS